MSRNIFGYTSQGGRKNNEDMFGITEDAAYTLLIVADGLGGHECGERASASATEVIQQEINAADSISEETVKNAIIKANDAIIEMQKDGDKMKTTVGVAVIIGEKTIVAHVGDSRIYAFKQGEIVFQSEDHSASQLAVALGEITADQIRHHEERNILTKALGASDCVKSSVSVLEDVDALLLCTDGFWEFVLEEDMENEYANSKSAKKWIKKMKKIHDKSAPGNCDNNTAICYRK